MRTFRLIGVSLVSMALCLNFASCYDDSEIWDKVNSLDDRMEQLENSIETYNENITSLNVIVKALQDNLYIKEMSSVSNGYIITFFGWHYSNYNKWRRWKSWRRWQGCTDY